MPRRCPRGAVAAGSRPTPIRASAVRTRRRCRTARRTARRNVRQPARDGTSASPRTRRSGRRATRRRVVPDRGAPRRARAHRLGAAASSIRISRPSSKSRRTRPACSSIPTSTRASRSGTSGASSSGVDEPASRPELPVDGAELGRRGHVRHREPPERRRIGRAREQERLARLAVAPRPTHHLHVPLERVRVVHEADEPHVGLVDAHAERRRGDHSLCRARDEVVLDARALLASRPAW